MILGKLRWKNFMSYGNSWTEIDLDLNEIVNVIGQNGRGKSVFIDVLHYAMTGKPFRAVKMSEVWNSINKKNCLVELETRRGENEVRVRRGMNPKVFEIWVNGKKKDEDASVADLQKTLERILGFNSKTLRHTIIMSSMNYTPFLKMAAAEKRLFIDDILGVGVFTELSAFVKNRFGLLKAKLTDAEYSIKKLESNLEIIREMNSKVVVNSGEQIALFKTKIKTFEKEIGELKAEIEETVPTIDGISEWLEDSEEELNSEVARIQSAAEKSTKKVMDKLAAIKAEIGDGVLIEPAQDLVEAVGLVATLGEPLAEQRRGEVAEVFDYEAGHVIVIKENK